MTANRRMILTAFLELENTRAKQSFTFKEIAEAAPDVNPKTLRFHLNSYLAEGQYHDGRGTAELEWAGKQGREYLYRLTAKGRLAAERLLGEA